MNWTAANCDRGPGRWFCDCETDGGDMVQERAGKTVPLAVGFDVRVVSPDAVTDRTVVVEVDG